MLYFINCGSQKCNQYVSILQMCSMFIINTYVCSCFCLVLYHISFSIQNPCNPNFLYINSIRPTCFLSAYIFVVPTSLCYLELHFYFLKIRVSSLRGFVQKKRSPPPTVVPSLVGWKVGSNRGFESHQHGLCTSVVSKTQWPDGGNQPPWEVANKNGSEIQGPHFSLMNCRLLYIHIWVNYFSPINCRL